jgi:hypothetical protein
MDFSAQASEAPGLPDLGTPEAEPTGADEPAAPAADSEGESMDWGNIALDSPEAAANDESGFGLAGGDEEYKPTPPPPVPMEESEPSAAPIPAPIPEYSDPGGGGEPQPTVPTYQHEAPAKSGGGKGTFFLILILLAGLGAAGYFFGYPMLQEYLGSKAGVQTGTLTIANQTATAIKRDDGNILSVVRGEVKNDTGKSVGLIEVIATFLGPNDQVLGQSSSFCGNLFTDAELRSDDLQKIRSELQYELGQAMSNNSIQAGASVPFLVLLENSSMDIKRVTVKVAGYKETT